MQWISKAFSLHFAFVFSQVFVIVLLFVCHSRMRIRLPWSACGVLLPGCSAARGLSECLCSNFRVIGSTEYSQYLGYQTVAEAKKSLLMTWDEFSTKFLVGSVRLCLHFYVALRYSARIWAWDFIAKSTNRQNDVKCSRGYVALPVPLLVALFDFLYSNEAFESTFKWISWVHTMKWNSGAIRSVLFCSYFS